MAISKKEIEERKKRLEQSRTEVRQIVAKQTAENAAFRKSTLLHK
jgi:hypothetical protein